MLTPALYQQVPNRPTVRSAKSERRHSPTRSAPIPTLSNQAMQRRLAQTIQPKLTVNQPGDAYEQEADRVADQVMRMPTGGASIQTASPQIQRLCSQCEEDLQRQSIDEDEEETVQAKAMSSFPSPVSTASSPHDSLPHGGQPLPPSVRAFFEPRFGYDFSQVKIHTNSQAAESAQALNARAYTYRNNVVFNRGEYSPETNAGRHLLAHELTHVVQQSGASHPPVQRQAVPNYRDCTPGITGIADSNERLEAARQRARDYVDVAIARLDNAPAAGSVYATALNRHFITPTDAERTQIRNTYRQIRQTLVVRNYICNSNRICGTEQAFWIAADDLVHVCRAFWDESLTCRAIILIHEGAHDVGIRTPGGHAPNRGDPEYPAGNTAPPAGETTAGRMNTPDAYAFFAAHVWRRTDTSLTCFS